jgi:hypothetical protein
MSDVDTLLSQVDAGLPMLSEPFESRYNYFGFSARSMDYSNPI